jgi:hypothetical protein
MDLWERIYLSRATAGYLLHTGCVLVWFSTLKMEVIRFSETSIHIWTTRRYIPEDSSIHNYRCENHKSFVFVFLAQIPRFDVAEEINLWGVRKVHCGKQRGGMLFATWAELGQVRIVAGHLDNDISAVLTPGQYYVTLCVFVLCYSWIPTFSLSSPSTCMSNNIYYTPRSLCTATAFPSTGNWRTWNTCSEWRNIQVMKTKRKRERSEIYIIIEVWNAELSSPDVLFFRTHRSICTVPKQLYGSPTKTMYRGSLEICFHHPFDMSWPLNPIFID